MSGGRPWSHLVSIRCVPIIMRESCAAALVAVILAHNVSHVRIASVDGKLFIHHEASEQQNTRAPGERSGTKVRLAKVARIQYSGRRLFSVVLWYLDTASSVKIIRPTVTNLRDPHACYSRGGCAIRINPRIEQERGIVYVSPVSSNHGVSSDSSQSIQ
jgi:hypothetical protein